MSLRRSIADALRRAPASPADPNLATDPHALESWMTAWIAAKVSLDPALVGRDQPFTEFGLDSLLAVNLSGALEQIVGRPLSPSIAWEYPTPAELAAYLAAGGSGSEEDMDALTADAAD